ncbi:hypothetical protein [Ornithinibacillus scapharcae]|uniref:hypothetical protein n=1 Tax=Ornithinibacillus scapharcae TaxID=1147159 RepID=UPI000225AB23|nr:hypothetical protein [Ornithinibacillus scapharcae]
MMKKILGLLFLFVLVLTACSHEQPAIVKVETPPEDTKEEPELIEEVTDNEKVDEFIEFTLEEEVVRVNLNQIPILSSYLHAVKDRQQVIEKMDFQHLLNIDDNDIYLLEFSCNKADHCSYLLLDHNSENTDFLVADLASYEEFILSPEGTKLLLKFSRDTSQEYSVSNIVVIDLQEWDIMSLENDDIENNLLDYNWPILSTSWVDDESILISVPDTLQTNTEKTDTEIIETTNDILFNVSN